MTLEERIDRNNTEDQIEIGQIAEKLTMGDSGSLLKCLVEGIKEEILQRADEDMDINADRSLGKLTSLNALQERLDQCVDIKNQLTAEQKENNKVG